MAKIYDFPTFLEDTIRLADATHWVCSKDFCSMFVSGKSYLLEQNEWTEEWYVTDDQGSKNYSFYIVEGDFINMKNLPITA